MSNFNIELQNVMKRIHGKHIYYGTYNNKTSLYTFENDKIEELYVDNQDYKAMVFRIVMNIFLDQKELPTVKINDQILIKQKLNDHFYKEYEQIDKMDTTPDEEKYVIIKNETMTDIFMAKVLDNTTNNIYIALLSDDDKRRYIVHSMGDCSEKVFYVRDGNVLTYITADQKDEWQGRINDIKKEIQIIKEKEANDVNDIKKEIKNIHKKSFKTRKQLFSSLIDENNSHSLKM